MTPKDSHSGPCVPSDQGIDTQPGLYGNPRRGSPPYRVVFMGCPDFAVPSLEALVATPDFEIAAIYCMPDRPQGRGHRPGQNPVKQAALRLGIEVRQPASFRRNPQGIADMRALDPDFLVVVAYGLLLPREVLAIPRIAPVNVHASLLPRHRGPSPIHAALLHGDQETGNSVMLMNERMDEGNLLARQTLEIAPDDTIGSLHDRLKAMGAPLLVNTLVRLANRDILPEPQDHRLATYTTKITSDHARLDWKQPAGYLERLVRAMTPCPGAWFPCGGERLKVGQARLGDSTSASAGSILQASPAIGIQIACGSGTSLWLDRLQRPGKSMLTAAEFLHGCPLIRDRALE